MYRRLHLIGRRAALGSPSSVAVSISAALVIAPLGPLHAATTEPAPQPAAPAPATEPAAPAPATEPAAPAPATEPAAPAPAPPTADPAAPAPAQPTDPAAAPAPTAPAGTDPDAPAPTGDAVLDTWSTPETPDPQTPPPVVVPISASDLPPLRKPPPAWVEEEIRRGKRLQDGGIATLVFGLSSLTFVALPAWILRRIALDRAISDPLFVDEESLYERAWRRMIIGSVATGIGIGLVGAGIPMIVVGRRRQQEAKVVFSLHPAADPGLLGARARLRF